MKITVVCLLLALLSACSDNTSSRDVKKIDDNVPQTSSSVPSTKENIPHKICTIVRVDYESMCDIYTLDCEGETEYALVCHTKPIGRITNPPRPINLISIKQFNTIHQTQLQYNSLESSGKENVETMSNCCSRKISQKQGTSGCN
jgi:hypothetical protein